MPISSNSFVDIAYFNLMAGDDLVIETSSDPSDDQLRLTSLINIIVQFFEEFCKRPLKARDFSYVSAEVAYNPKYSIFDPPSKDVFWFPTYPINSLTTFMISDEVISEAIDYEDTEGYFLYKHIGKLVYSYGFDYGYIQNIKAKWNGGYNSTHQEYEELKYLSYLFIKSLWDNDPNEDGIIAETLGNYKYTKADPKSLSKYLGIPSFVFHTLNNYKRYSI